MPRGKQDTSGQLFGGKDWEKLQDDLKRLGPGIQREFQAEMRNVARTVARAAQRKAPVRSGALRRGITTSVTRGHVSVVSKAPHGRIVESGGRHPLFGNRKFWFPQKPRPHIRPAVQEAGPEVQKKAAEAVQRAALAAGWR